MQDSSRQSTPVVDFPPGTAASAAELDAGAEQASQTIASEQLFRGARVLHIQHEGALYQLRLTKLGKLILTK